MLKITLVSGQEQDVPFDPTSTLTVTNQGFVDGVATPITASYSEIASLEIVADPEPEVATVTSEDPPAPIVPTGGVPVDTNAVTTEPTSSDAPAEETIPALGPDGQPVPTADGGVVIPASADVVVPATDQEPVAESDTSNPQLDEQAAPQSVGEALAAATPATGDPGDETAVTEPTDSAPADPPPALTDAIANAGAVVDAAVADPPAHVDHLAQAQTDVDNALATWPDDPNLLDLKTQLADLAADASEQAPPAA